jgi:hypothetical protein
VRKNYSQAAGWKRQDSVSKIRQLLSPSCPGHAAPIRHLCAQRRDRFAFLNSSPAVILHERSRARLVFPRAGIASIALPVHFPFSSLYFSLSLSVSRSLFAERPIFPSDIGRRGNRVIGEKKNQRGTSGLFRLELKSPVFACDARSLRR